MKRRVLTIGLTIFCALPLFARPNTTGMEITTKSPRARSFFEQGLKKMELLHFDAGMDNWRRSVHADPNFALGHIFLAFFSPDPAEQVTEREKALATRRFAGTEEKLIIDWISNASHSNWVPAIQAMNEALEQYPHDKYLAWMAGWWLALMQNQSPRALLLFERVIKLDENFPDAWNEAAYCYAKAGNFDKAFADIQRYTELVPNEPNPHDSFAELSRMAGHFEDALKHYRMSLKIDPSFHESQLGLGDTYTLMGDQPRARVEYETAIGLGTPVQKVVWGLQLAATYVREGDFAGADKAYRKIAQQAHEMDFASHEAEAYRAMAMYQTDSAAATELFKKAEAVLHEKHKVPQALLNEELAAVWRAGLDRALQEGDSSRAQALLQQLSDLASANSDDIVEAAYAGGAGAVFLAEGKYTDAISSFKGDPTNPFSMRGMVTAYEKSGQTDSASHMAAALASFNIPVIEQALVVPGFRKQRAATQTPTSGKLQPHRW
jgi:tetratricopeptide (TPR) repeat protein